MSEQSSTGRTERNAERTRNLVLDTATQMLFERGPAVTLTAVAEEAGVSKGGLLHHFRTRESLLLAVLQQANERFRTDVFSRVDLSENTPGKLLRAYVRTLCTGEPRTLSLFAASSFWAGLHGIAGVDEIADAENARWTAELCADGLDAELVRIIRRAAEGLAAAAAYGEETVPHLQSAGRRLIAMTHEAPHGL